MKSFKSYISEAYSVQYIRDKNMDVLKIKDTKKPGHVEVRGKKNYETSYDRNDPMHSVIDKLGKAANISDLMNSEIVYINPRHPHGKKAIESIEMLLKEDGPCWDGYKQVGMKKKNGKEVPNCVPEEVKLEEGSETWEAGFKRRVVKTTKPEHKEDGYNWRIKGKDRNDVSIKLYKKKPSFQEFKKQMRRVAGHEFGG